MKLIEKRNVPGYERVIGFRDPRLGLRGFLALHSTRLGPAFGGVRLLRYESEHRALEDALHLSRAMTYKCALAGLPAGGGKAVLLDHPGLQRAEAFAAFGEIVESLAGRFFTGCDVGIEPGDLAAIRTQTSHVACESSDALGDIHEHTAVGVWHAFRACLEAIGLKPRGARAVLQGAGNVGRSLGRILVREGLELRVADVDEDRARGLAAEIGALVVPPDRVLSEECDVLVPCALGGVLGPETIRALRTRVVCGAANNQLRALEDGDRLARAGVLYAPDYLANAGGVIRGVEFYLHARAESWSSLERIHDRMLRVARFAAENGVSTARIAEQLAEERLTRGRD